MDIINLFSIALVITGILFFWVTAKWGNKYYNSVVALFVVSAIWGLFPIVASVAEILRLFPIDEQFLGSFPTALDLLFSFWFFTIPVVVFFMLFGRFLTYVLWIILITVLFLWLSNSSDIELHELIMAGFLNPSEISIADRITAAVVILISTIVVITIRSLVIKISVPLLSGFHLFTFVWQLPYWLGLAASVEDLLEMDLSSMNSTEIFTYYTGIDPTLTVILALICFGTSFYLQFAIFADPDRERIIAELDINQG